MAGIIPSVRQTLAIEVLFNLALTFKPFLKERQRSTKCSEQLERQSLGHHMHFYSTYRCELTSMTKGKDISGKEHVPFSAHVYSR